MTPGGGAVECVDRSAIFGEERGIWWRSSQWSCLGCQDEAASRISDEVRKILKVQRKRLKEFWQSISAKMVNGRKIKPPPASVSPHRPHDDGDSVLPDPNQQ